MAAIFLITVLMPATAAFAAVTPSLSLSPASFTEAAANNGSMGNIITVTVSNTTFSSTAATNIVLNTALPSGLSLSVVRLSTTQVTIALTGNAASHQAANNFSASINFKIAAFASSSGNVIKSIPVNFTNNPSLAYSTATYTEAAANDGSISNKITVTLTGDTYNTDAVTDYIASGRVSITNVPAGLIATATEKTSTTLEIALTGNAAAHQSANSITNLTVQFNNAAFASNNAAAVSSSTKSNIAVTFTNNPSLAYSTSIFTEAAANDGSISNKITVTISGGTTFNTDAVTDYVAGGRAAVSNVPSGLTATVTKKTSTTVEIALTGYASVHQSANSISNLTIQFTNAAFANGSAIAVLNSTNNNIAVTFTDNPTLSYSAATFTESSAFDGSISNKITVTISGSTTFNTDGTTDYISAGRVAVTNVPSGLTATVTKKTSTTVEIALTGNASAHQSANSISNLTVQFANAAFANGNAAAVFNSLKNNIAVVYADNPSLSYSTAVFTESSANDGSITNKITVTIIGDTFNTDAVTDYIASGRVTITNVPAGLTATATEKTSATLEIALTGNAAAHQAANSISNLTVQFGNAAFACGNAAAVSSSTKSNIAVTFTDNASLAYSASTFTEASANDGSISNKITVTITGSTFNTDAATDYISSGRAAVTNVPSGLTATVTKKTSTTVEISLTGNAAAHQAANNISNLTIQFANGAFAGGNAAAVLNSTKSNITITFTDNPSLSYSAAVFTEASVNDGSMGNTITVTITGSTFNTDTATDYISTGRAVVSNVPAGLTATVTKKTSTTVEIALTGMATVHQSANSITNLTVQFNDTAFATGITAVAVFNSTKNNISISFADNIIVKTLVYDSGPFLESKDNDGSISNGKVVVLEGALFANTAFTAGTQYVASNVPAGLTMTVTRDNDSQVTIWLTGKATSHTSANNVSNVGIRFLDAAFSGTSASAVIGYSKQDMSIQFTTSNKLRVLEVYPSAAAGGDGDFKDLSAKNPSNMQITSMSLNKFISMVDDINGNYDIVYFGRGRYFKNDNEVTDVTKSKYGNDITDRRAKKVLDFINSGQLCVFYSDAFKVDNLDKNDAGGGYTKMYTNFYSLTTTRTNVKVISSVSDLDSLTTYYNTLSNARPVLNIIAKPVSYRNLADPLTNNQLTFTYKGNDTGSGVQQLSVKLFIDKNSDGMFEDSECVEQRIINNNKYDTINYYMPDDLTGVYFWKLEVSDNILNHDLGAKDEYVDVFRLKGKVVNVRVLQIMPPGNTGDLNSTTMFNKPVSDGSGNLYGYRVGEYRIQVTQVTVNDFNSPPTPDTLNLKNLNGNYDMLVLGFADSFGSADLNDDACARVSAFIATGQSVMFTHDTIMYASYAPPANLKKYFLNTVGQTDAVTAGQIRRNQYESSDPTSTTLVNNYYLANSSINGDYLNDTVDASTLITSIKNVNSSEMTLYPFNLVAYSQSSMVVAGTHYQYYKLNLEDPDVVPLFNLYSSSIDERLQDDAMNNYYTYSKDNITYSGTGHTGGYPDYEVMLFVNTVMKAYNNSNHAPQVDVYEPVDMTRVSASKSTLHMSFKPYDFDYKDSILTAQVFIDSANNGTWQEVQIPGGSSVANGSKIEFDMPKGFSDTRTFRIKIKVTDTSQATVEKVMTLYNTQDMVLNAAMSTDMNGYLVGQTAKVSLNVSATGSSIDPVTMQGVRITQTVPAGLSYNGIQTGASFDMQGYTPVVFTSAGPVPSAAQQLQYSLVPAASGSYIVNSALNYTLNNTQYTVLSNVNLEVRSGNVEIYVKDDMNNPITDTVISADGANSGKKTDAGGRYIFTDVSAGSHNYNITVPTGYKLFGIKLMNIATGQETSISDLTSAVATGLSYNNYSYRITYQLRLDISLKFAFYYLTPDNVPNLLSDDGTGQATVKTFSNSLVRVVARFTFPVMQGNKLISLIISPTTLTVGGQNVVTQNAAVVLSTPVTVSGWSGVTQLYGNNANSQGIPAGDYYAVLQIPKALLQTNVTLNSVALVFSNGSAYDMSNSGTNTILIRQLNAPHLR